MELPIENAALYRQVSTGTGIMIYYYNVSVVVPSTSIVGGSEYHVDKGSAIQLTCIIRNVIEPLRCEEWRETIYATMPLLYRFHKSRNSSSGITTTG